MSLTGAVDRLVTYCLAVEWIVGPGQCSIGKFDDGHLPVAQM